LLHFGELSAGEPGGSSRLSDALMAATAAGRAVMVITDGELADVASIPADILSLAQVVVVPRSGQPDLAITDVRTPERIVAGDSLRVELRLQRTGAAVDSVEVQLRDGSRVLLAGVARFAPGSNREGLVLEGVLPAGIEGERWLDLVRVGGPD